MDQRGATSAYRGYRLQALYTLARILEPGDSARSFFSPKGKRIWLFGTPTAIYVKSSRSNPIRTSPSRTSVQMDQLHFFTAP